MVMLHRPTFEAEWNHDPGDIGERHTPKGEESL
jgi:hypothetical protein